MALVSGSVLNIILDYWFIVALEMGLYGAALATGLSQILAVIIYSLYFFSQHRTLHFHFRQSRSSGAFIFSVSFLADLCTEALWSR